MHLLCEEMYLTQIFGTQGSGVLWPYKLKINLVFLILHYYHVLRPNNKLKVFQPLPHQWTWGCWGNLKKRYLLNRTTTIDPLPYCFRGNQWIQICACGWRDNFVISIDYQYWLFYCHNRMAIVNKTTWHILCGGYPGLLNDWSTKLEGTQ